MTTGPLSLYPAAQDALAERLRARPLIRASNVLVSVGWPAGGLKAEHIWIQVRTPSWTQQWATSGQAGPAGIDETFTITVSTVVIKSAKDHVAVRDRAFELVGELQRELRDDFTLGGVVAYATFAGGRVDEGIADRQRDVVVECDVRCEGYLTADPG